MLYAMACGDELHYYLDGGERDCPVDALQFEQGWVCALTSLAICSGSRVTRLTDDTAVAGTAMVLNGYKRDAAARLNGMDQQTLPYRMSRHDVHTCRTVPNRLMRTS